MAKTNTQEIFNGGTKFVCKGFVAFFLFATPESATYTIIASRKIGNAVKRNRAKRRLREIIRLHIKPNTPTLQLILLARNDTSSIKHPLLLQDCEKLVKKICNCSAE